MKTNHILHLVLSILFITIACSNNNRQDKNDKIDAAVTKPFTEGIVEMGIYSHGIDIGYYINNIDFTQGDTRQQLEALIKEQGPENNLISHIQTIGKRTPMAGLALILNTVICDYYIKGETVFGKAKGFGFTYDHFHDQQHDVGKIYIEAVANIPQIPDADRKLYVEYKPSEQKSTNPNSSFDVDLFDRQSLDKKENILGYDCDVAVYTLKAGSTPPPADPNNPMPAAIMHKLVVYTSPLFSNTINFTHPFYIPEAGGILRVDIFLEDNEQPTLEMRPYKITPQPIREDQLAIKSASPVYQMDSFAWGMKALGIFMGGWSTFKE